MLRGKVAAVGNRIAKEILNLPNARSARLDFTKMDQGFGRNLRSWISETRSDTNSFGALDRKDTLFPFERT